jgi:Secretion system C-terminal sorting domain
MRASTLKGLAIHTANECGTSQGPDYQYGWGLLNIERAAEVIANKTQNHFITESVLYRNSTNSFQIVASGKSPLVATICWTDPEGTPTDVKPENLNNRKPKLINDLDIRIVDEQGTFLPWVLNPDAPSQVATQGDNFRDNVEQIYIEKPIAGRAYTITVNHKGASLKGDIQYYSLIVSGLTGRPCQASAAITASGNTLLCNGSVKLLTNSGTNLSYTWNWNDQPMPLTDSPSFVARVAGKFSVTITQGKCSATSPTVTVENVQAPIISSDNGSNICTGNINLGVKNLIGTGIKYQWTKDGRDIAKATNSTLSISETGDYTVRTLQNNCAATSIPFSINNTGTPISTNPETGKYLLIGGYSNTIQAITTGNVKYNFQWFRNGVAIPNATNASINVRQGGKYTVRATAGKCVSVSGVVEYEVVSASRVMAFDDENQNIETEPLILSPNPTNEWLKIQYFNPQNTDSEPTFEIINTLGMSVLSDKLERNNPQYFIKEINVRDLTTGMYIVRIVDGQKVLVKKFLRGE